MQLREARASDRDAVGEVHVRSWQVAYRGLLPDEYLDGMRADERAQRYTFGLRVITNPTTIVAVEDDDLLGFATFGASSEDDCGELKALYVDPAHWGSGAGYALIEEVRERLQALGFEQACLWMLVGNQRAERFYRADGWLPDGTQRQDQVWGLQVDEVRYARPLTNS